MHAWFENEEEVPFDSEELQELHQLLSPFLLKSLRRRTSSIPDPERADATFPGLVNSEFLAETVGHRGNSTFNFKLLEERS